METDPRIWIAALHRGHDRLADLVDGITPEELAGKSMCSEWNVAQVLSHLGSGAEIGLAGLRGTPVVNEEVWDRWNALSPNDAATSFVTADEQLVTWWEQQTDDQLVAFEQKLPFLPTPLDAVGALSFRLNEVALHSWDVLAPKRGQAEVAPEAVALLVDRLPFMVGLVGSFRPRETRPEVDTTIAVVTHAPPRLFELELGDKAELRPVHGEAKGTGQLTLPSEALLRLTSGRLSNSRINGTVAQGALNLDKLRTAFPPF